VCLASIQLLMNVAPTAAPRVSRYEYVPLLQSRAARRAELGLEAPEDAGGGGGAAAAAPCNLLFWLGFPYTMSVLVTKYRGRNGCV
jgi:hypothetical protein